MRHAPYESEYLAVPTMRDGELLDYFLMRCFETDEVWFLKEMSQPFERDLADVDDSQTTFPVWPYQRFASEAASDQWPACIPSAIALDHFLYRTLDELIERDVTVEIMPRGNDTGCLIAPQRLLSILEGMIDVGEYRLDG